MSLHLPQKEISPSGQEEVDTASFGDAVMPLSGYQVAEKQLYLAEKTRGYPEFNDGGDSVSSGSMSFDLGDMCRYGCPKNPDSDSELELNSVEEEERESVKDHLRQVIGSSLSATVHEFLTSTGGVSS